MEIFIACLKLYAIYQEVTFVMVLGHMPLHEGNGYQRCIAHSITGVYGKYVDNEPIHHKLVQSFRVTGLFTSQYNTKDYGTLTCEIQAE